MNHHHLTIGGQTLFSSNLFFHLWPFGLLPFGLLDFTLCFSQVYSFGNFMHKHLFLCLIEVPLDQGVILRLLFFVFTDDMFNLTVELTPIEVKLDDILLEGM